MDPHTAQMGLIGLPLVLLVAAVLSVPIARFGRLSPIVAYLAAGVVIGPYGLKILDTPEHILAVAELGVVMLLFLIDSSSSSRACSRCGVTSWASASRW